MKNFSVETQYQLYLERISLDEMEMHPEQRKQLRETFFGAVGQLLQILRDDISEYEEDEAVEIMEGMLDEVTTFFLGKNKN